MTDRFVPPSAERIAKVRSLAERQLGRDEFDAYVRAPWGNGEREAATELIAWFVRRYPTVLERLQAARRSYQRARARMPP